MYFLHALTWPPDLEYSFILLLLLTRQYELPLDHTYQGTRRDDPLDGL